MSGFGIRRCCCNVTQYFNLCRLNATGSPPGSQWKEQIGGNGLQILWVPHSLTTVYATANPSIAGYYVVDEDGDLIDQSTPNFFEVDASGNTYTIAGGDLLKHDSSGTETWSSPIASSTAASLSVDLDGNIVVCHFGGTVGVEYFDSSGNLVWDSPAFVDAFSLSRVRWAHFDSDGNVYAVAQSVDPNGDFIEKFDSSGSSQWKYPTDPTTYAGVSTATFSLLSERKIDSNTYVVLTGAINGWEKVSGGGSQTYQSSPSDSQAMVQRYRVDSEDNWYINIPNLTDVTDNKIKKYQSDGTLVWTETGIPNRITGQTGHPMAMDAEDQLWVGGASTIIV